MPRHVPFWLDRFPKSRRRPSYPPFRGQLDTDVVIVGGGLTGCACACVVCGCRRAGSSLLEADRIGAARTAASPGSIREDFDASFQETAAAHGLRAARTLWQGMRRASLDFAAALKRLRTSGAIWRRRTCCSVARRDADAVRRLRREYDARRAPGFDHSWMTRGGAGARGRRSRRRGHPHARLRLRSVSRLPRASRTAAAERGATLFERTPVRRIRASRKHVEVDDRRRARCARRRSSLPPARRCRICARSAVISHPQQSYAVVTEPLPAAVRRELGRRAAALRDGASPAALPALAEGRSRRSSPGADQEPVPARARDKMLVQRSRSADVRAVDDLPGHLRRDAGVVLGRTLRRDGRRPAVRRSPPQLSRAISSRSATAGTAPASRGSPRGCCCGSSRARPTKATSSSVSAASSSNRPAV